MISALCLNIGLDLGVVLIQNTMLAIRKIKLEWLKSKQRWALEDKTKKKQM